MRLTVRRGRRIITAKVPTIPLAKRNWNFINEYNGNQTGYKEWGNDIAYIYAPQIWRGNMDTIKQFIRRKKAVIFGPQLFDFPVELLLICFERGQFAILLNVFL